MLAKCLVFHWIYTLRCTLSKAQKDCFIAATTDEVYDDTVQLGPMEEHVYDVIDKFGDGYTKASFTAGTKKTPCLPYLLPTVSPTVVPPTYGNEGVAKEGDEEVVYDIPCD